MEVLKTIVALCLTIILSSTCLAGDLSAPQDLAFTADYDGSVQRYIQMLPVGYDLSQPVDIMIALHGHGSDRWQFATGTFDEARATRDVAASHNMVYITPDYRATTSWMGPAAEADMIQLINTLKSQYNVGKVFLVGGSMGGSSAMTFTALHPDLIDGVSARNGLANHVEYTNFQDAIAASFGGTKTQVPEQYYNRSAEFFPNSFTMPFSVTAGGNDTLVPPDSVMRLSRNVAQTNPNAVAFYRPNGGHSTNYVDTAVALEYVVRNAKGINTDLNPITINTSFENPRLPDDAYTSNTIEGFTVVNAGGFAGIVNSTQAVYNAEFTEPMPDGDQIAFANNFAFYQYLGTTVQPGIYHLSFYAGSQLSNTAPGTFIAGFMIADNNVAETADLIWGDANAATTGPGLIPGKWSLIELDWTVDPDNPSIGKYLYINFWANSSNFVHFDDIQVIFTPVPEPATILFLVPGLWAIKRLRRRC
ncbi:MAG: alpha/beta hydrolase [Phycisphaerae bacterium]|jgi:pimeloyl-ACP methyl ester carboxylesterase|nr:alpha/beta hydrolase [Phycisphaerae bacterium]